ncbi:hypothetical protein [Aquabacter spiritensis]|uniref:Uncharacterized protein n=1 Tax=Aquabacter spiritensis TaxID=933073 RepID=A0A4R3M4Z3_9HYPH|nr:hypothetical protein [Aquabacter spiritensis]TCT08092.1 hypothetical protein EDC64_101612 [Aquabacter spiritensis]
MKKLLVGLVAVAVLVGGGFLGLVQYSQARARAEVDRVFQELRAAGREATHGPVGFDLYARTLTVADIRIAARDGIVVTAASLIVSGIAQTEGGDIAARRIEANALSLSLPNAQAGSTATYLVPSLVVTDYSGPPTLVSGGANDGHTALRLTLRQLAATTASRISAPAVTARLSMPGADGAQISTEIVYTNLSTERLEHGRMAHTGFDRVTFVTAGSPGDPASSMKGRLDGFSASNVDTAPLRALAEGEAMGGYATFYEKVSAAAYVVEYGDGTTMQVGSAQGEGFAIDPGVLTLDRLDEMDMFGASSTALNREDGLRRIGASGDRLKGWAFASMTLRDVAARDETATMTARSLTLSDFKDGRLGAFTVEGMGSEEDGEPGTTMDKGVLRGLTFLPLLELSATRGEAGDALGVEAALALLRAIEGIEVSGLIVPQAHGGPPLKVKSLSLGWGQYIGLVPTSFALAATGLEVAVPSDEPMPLTLLADAGLKTVALDLDLALGYDPAAQAIVLSPASARIDTAFAISLEARLAEVARSAFEDPISALSAAPRIEVGPAKLTLTDLGIVGLLLKTRADRLGIAPEDLRAELVSTIRQQAAQLAPLSPDAPALGEAIAAFLAKPGTLTVTLTPRESVKLMDLIAGDPLLAIQDFSVTAINTP